MAQKSVLNQLFNPFGALGSVRNGFAMYFSCRLSPSMLRTASKWSQNQSFPLNRSGTIEEKHRVLFLSASRMNRPPPRLAEEEGVIHCAAHTWWWQVASALPFSLLIFSGNMSVLDIISLAYCWSDLMQVLSGIRPSCRCISGPFPIRMIH